MTQTAKAREAPAPCAAPGLATAAWICSEHVLPLEGRWVLDTDSNKRLLHKHLGRTRAESLAAESKTGKLGKTGKTNTDKFVFNKGVNFLSTLYKTIAIKNFIFESKIFTYEQVTVQNLHEKMERRIS